MAKGNTSTASVSPALDARHYVVLQENAYLSFTPISGPVPHPPTPMPPGMFPFYYNKSSPPPGGFPYPINDSLKILLGAYGPSNLLDVVEISDLPYTFEPGITITSVDNDGNVEIIYDGEHIDLKPGTSWTSPASTWNSTGNITHCSPSEPNMTTMKNCTDIPYTVQYSETWIVENKGVFDK